MVRYIEPWFDISNLVGTLFKTTSIWKLTQNLHRQPPPPSETVAALALVFSQRPHSDQASTDWLLSLQNPSTSWLPSLLAVPYAREKLEGRGLVAHQLKVTYEGDLAGGWCIVPSERWV